MRLRHPRMEDENRERTCADLDSAKDRIPFTDAAFASRPSRRPSSLISDTFVNTVFVNTVYVAWVSFAALLFAATTIIAATSVVSVDRAFADDVVPGTFIPETRECSPGRRGGEPSCSWLGTYTDEDTTIDDVLLDEELTSESAGEALDVRWNGDRDDPVVLLDNSDSRSRAIVLIALTWCGVTGLCVYAVIRSHRRRRTEIARHEYRRRNR